MPFPVELHKVDPYGRPTADYYIGFDNEGEEWATCWFSGVHRRQHIHMTTNPVSAVRVGPPTCPAPTVVTPPQPLQQNMNFAQHQQHDFQTAAAPHVPYFGPGI